MGIRSTKDPKQLSAGRTTIQPRSLNWHFLLLFVVTFYVTRRGITRLINCPLNSVKHNGLKKNEEEKWHEEVVIASSTLLSFFRTGVDFAELCYENKRNNLYLLFEYLSILSRINGFRWAGENCVWVDKIVS